jgi:hypothetical protein
MRYARALRGASLLLLSFSAGCQADPHPSAAPNKAVDTRADFEAAPAQPGAPETPAAAPRKSAAAPGDEAAPRQITAAAPAVAAVASTVEERPILDGPGIAATNIATTVYAAPNKDARRLGYLRLGAIVQRALEPVSGSGCSGKWYAILPQGYLCTDEATLDLEAPLVRASARRPALDRPLPYRYGFVRATAPQYLRVPTRAEQFKSELKLDEHLAWFEQNAKAVQRASLGANDVPLDARGLPVLGLPLQPGQRLSTQLWPNELLGGRSERGEVPFWLVGGRQLPNVSGFDVPNYAVFADRVRRKTGLSFVDAFVVEEGGLERGFALTVDLRLIPTSKVKPDTGSAFHGVEVTPELALPFAIVSRRDARGWQLVRGRDEVREGPSVPHRSIVPLSGDLRFKAGARFYQTARDPRLWLRADEIGVVAAPSAFPEAAERGEKWIDVSLVQQTLVLYSGKRPQYATLISSGQDRLGDPATEKATPRGVFTIQSKHIAAAMDSEENSNVAGGQRAPEQVELTAADNALIARLRAQQKAGKSLSLEDQQRLNNVERGRHPEYGITHRRGASDYELRDVPWIQYFESGYALHGAYWHDVFGIPRSHGCINLSPIDAFVVFNWTEPKIPRGWHGINSGGELGAGTVVAIRE